MSTLTFSIVFCNYNYGRFVGDAIASALAQDYSNDHYEVIVVDDGSTDNSREVIETARARGAVRAVLQENRGQAAAYLAGVEAARNEFVCLLDSDDVYLPGKLAAVARRIEALAPVGDSLFLCHDVEVRDETRPGERTPSWFRLTPLHAYGESLHFSNYQGFFLFSIPCGQVYSKALIRRVLGAMPLADFRNSTDNVAGHAAMLAAERVHYLHEPLGIYRIHGGHSLIVDGRYVSPREEYARWPKILAFLEHFVDTLDLDARGRGERQAYILRLGKTVREHSSRLQLAQAPASFVVPDSGETAHTIRTLASALASTYGKTDVALVTNRPELTDSLPAYLRPAGLRIVMLDAHAGHFDRLRAGYHAARGDYIAFLQAGDAPDPLFLERHVYGHRFLGLAAVSASDIRIVDDKHTLVHQALYHASGAWKHAVEPVPPLAVPIEQWLFPPLSANVVRRTHLLDLFFADGAETPDQRLDSFAGWLMLQYVFASGGALRLNECLLSYFPGADAAALSQAALMSPLDADRRPGQPDFDAAAAYLWRLYCRQQPAFHRALAPSWHPRFIAWMKQGRDRLTIARLAATAAELGEKELARAIGQ